MKAIKYSLSLLAVAGAAFLFFNQSAPVVSIENQTQEASQTTSDTGYAKPEQDKVAQAQNPQKAPVVKAKNNTNNTVGTITDEAAVELTAQQMKENIQNSVDNAGAVNFPLMRALLREGNFDDYMVTIADSASQVEMAKEQEVRDVLNTYEQLTAYDNNVVCGSEICALQIRDVPADKIKMLTKGPISNLPLGSIFTRTVKKEYGNPDIRVIYVMKEGSTLTLQKNN